jgi:PAS domain S-box-containing protein
MDSPTRILLVEDMPTDAELTIREIRKTLPSCSVHIVDTQDGFLAALSAHQPDIIVTDYSMPQFDGRMVLELAKQRAPMTPVVIVTGAINEDTAVECMKAGALDYVIKEHIKRLGQAVLHALEQRETRIARLKAEEDLKRNEERYRRFFEDDLSGVYLSTPRGQLLACNPAFVRIMGYESAEQIQTINTAGMYVSSSDRGSFLDALRQNGKLINSELTLVRRDGARIHAVENVVGIFSDGQLVEFIGYLFDVTEQKKRDATMRLLAHTMESVTEIATITDLEDRFTFVNQSFLQTYGYVPDEVIGKSVSMLWSPNNPPHLLEDILSQSKTGNWRGEVLNRKKDGTEFPLSLKTSQVRDEKGNILGLVGISEDITERKKADEQLRSSLREKEALLREIHHRVKNNLQVISSLLHMQAARSSEEKIKSVLEESEHRIRSMALIHEALYRTYSFSALDFGAHLRELVAALTRSYGRPGVNTTTEVEGVELPIDAAVPCGLIANELITNALKHAFPSQKNGTITVGLNRRSPELVELSVRDDGIGFPSDLDYREMTTMGMNIIESLVQQIDGVMTLDTSKGTTFVVAFPG